MKKIELKSILILLLIASLNFIGLGNAEQVYYPYPIVFVHGLSSSDEVTWIGMRDELRQYFKYGSTSQGTEEYKYPTHFTELNYFIGCDYGDQNNGVIKDIAKYRLSSKINEALFLYPPSVPESERKVIIVCHSMGGLVTRSLLKQIPSYKDKIYRVVFIDTPHLGSPYASALWLFNELKKDAKNDYKDTMYQSYSAFSPFALMYAGFIDYPDLYFKVGNTQRHINWLLFELERGGSRPSSEAIRDLRIPAFTYYEKVYQGFVSSIRRYKDYLGSDTFLGQSNLGVPADYKVIVGENPSGLATTLWKVADVFNLSEPFRFPTLAGEEQSLDHAIFNGDGIVTMSSQKLNKADYLVNAFHVGAADAAIDKTLQAIEDQPVIESAYAIPVDWNDTYAYKEYSGAYNSEHSWYYLIFKLKDYLLADIEVEKLDLITDAGATNLLTDYKPYLEFGKYFLKERDCTGEETWLAAYFDINDDFKYLHLMPGEFYVITKIPLNAQSVYIKIKNPADRYDDTHTKFIAERTFAVTRPKIAEFTWSPSLIDADPYYKWVRTPWVIDISPYDYSYERDDDGAIIGTYWGDAPRDSEGMNLSFKIENSPYLNIKTNIWLYGMIDTGSPGLPSPVRIPYIWRKFVTKRELSLDSSGSHIFDNFVIWHGEDDAGNKVPHYEVRNPNGDEKMNCHSCNYYGLSIITEPIESLEERKDNKIPILGSCLDRDMKLYWDDTEYRNKHNDIMGADPTFIQASRREGISW